MESSVWIDATAWRLDASTRYDDVDEYRRLYDHRRPLTFDLLPSAGGGSPFSPSRTIVPGDVGSPWSAGVPYSVTCPSRFDGGLRDVAAGRAQPVAAPVPPRPSSSGEPVASVPPLGEPRRQTSTSVFQISSYIIANGASDTPVQPSVAVEL